MSAELAIKDGVLCCQGTWTAQGIGRFALQLPQIMASLAPKLGDRVVIDGQQVERLDSAGIWCLEKIAAILQQQHKSVAYQNFDATNKQLINFISIQLDRCRNIPRRTPWPWLARFGKLCVQGVAQGISFISFVGEVFTTVAYLITHPRRIPWKMLCNTIQSAGFNALPIVGILSFLIGIVLVYQMGVQLRNYGANIFIVDLMGLAILREFAPLMTAIIIAGRTGSAFTAQIGAMKVNQEIDALSTMGIQPVQRLVIPKLLGLLIALPLLTVWADLMGQLGGMIMAKKMLGIDFSLYISRFHQAVPVRWFLVGMVKTPIFALLIATIGCFEGLNVEENADSVGKHTTKSVVKAIFLIITFDAIFSIVFSWMKI